ncbi:N-6 DNA methylase [Tepidimicrobium xylanilyticum]
MCDCPNRLGGLIGGFLIEAFRYIENNSILNKQDIDVLKKQTIYGREITTTARIAKMNMILQGDGHSGIEQADSLANPIDGEYDVVVTNIPFSQKTEYGKYYYNGIAKNNGDAVCVLHCLRSLKEGGRMALIVPEGFLFRNDLAEVREFLLNKAKLQSVISLPQGVFLPYTGVKTDILYFVDAHKTNNQKSYWYFDVKNDGYTLDNHRRKIKGNNDLNKINSVNIIDNGQIEDMQTIGFSIIDINKVKKNNYNLIGNIYLDDIYKDTRFGNVEYLKVKEFAKLIRGISYSKNQIRDSDADNTIRVVTTKAAQQEGIITKDTVIIEKENINLKDKLLKNNDIIISLANSLEHLGRVTFVDNMNKNITFGAFLGVIRCEKNNITPKYIYYAFLSDMVKKQIHTHAKTTTNISNIGFKEIYNILIPIYDLNYQINIVNELESYEAIIKSANNIINNYKTNFSTSSIENKVKLGDETYFELIMGQSPPSSSYNTDGDGILFIQGSKEFGDMYPNPIMFCTEPKKIAPKNSILISVRAPVGDINIANNEICIGRGLAAIIPTSKVNYKYLFFALKNIEKSIREKGYGSTFPAITKKDLSNIEIPLPDLKTQNDIVKKLEKEWQLIEQQKEVVKTFNSKMIERINEIFN